MHRSSRFEPGRRIIEIGRLPSTAICCILQWLMVYHFVMLRLRLSDFISLLITTMLVTTHVAYADSPSQGVIGGTNVPVGKWSDVAGIFIGGQVACTGTLIAPDVVITAGHCNDTALTQVVVGSNDTSITGRGEIIPVAKRFEYPSSQSTFDVTILKLAHPATIAPRKIATGWASLAVQNGAPVTFAGFGSIDAGGGEYIPQLQEASSTITDAGCDKSSGCNPGAKPAGELGAGGMGIDTCPGDSGGPLYVQLGNDFFLAGVTSRSYDNATSPCKDGGIYARPDKIVDWIETQVGESVGRGPAPNAAAVELNGSKAGASEIISNDPLSSEHLFEAAKEPRLANYNLAPDGRIKFCANGSGVGIDELVVRVSDKSNPARSLQVAVKLNVTATATSNDCNLSFAEDSGCGCQSHGDPTTLLGMAVLLAAGVGRRRATHRKLSWRPK
jgi:MYXO-CTERM domain-containing protein